MWSICNTILRGFYSSWTHSILDTVITVLIDVAVFEAEPMVSEIYIIKPVPRKLKILYIHDNS